MLVPIEAGKLKYTQLLENGTPVVGVIDRVSSSSAAEENYADILRIKIGIIVIVKS